MPVLRSVAGRHVPPYLCGRRGVGAQGATVYFLPNALNGECPFPVGGTPDGSFKGSSAPPASGRQLAAYDHRHDGEFASQRGATASGRSKGVAVPPASACQAATPRYFRSPGLGPASSHVVLGRKCLPASGTV